MKRILYTFHTTKRRLTLKYGCWQALVKFNNRLSMGIYLASFYSKKKKESLLLNKQICNAYNVHLVEMSMKQFENEVHLSIEFKTSSVSGWTEDICKMKKTKYKKIKQFGN